MSERTNHTNPQEYDFTYISEILDEASRPYDKLANFAIELGLNRYTSIIEEDALVEKQRSAYAFVNNIDKGLIDQIDLAHELAFIENDYQTAQAAVHSLSIRDSIVEKMVSKAKAESDSLQSELLDSYKAQARDFISQSTRNMIQAPEEVSIPRLDTDEIKANYDVSPITKDQILTITGSKAQATRFWKPLAALSGTSVRVHDGKRYVVGPELIFNIKPEHREGAGQLDDEELSDLDFVSFYSFVEWVNKTVEESSRLEISDILGKNVGRGTVEFYKQLILARSISS